jgi:2,4-dienoyl-CoA reductase-like NADH-dependent reductase (Old Yellow Enzyme family)/thioredoxin reductase
MRSSHGGKRRVAPLSLDVLLTPLEVKGIELKNRIVSTSHAPGFAEGGMPGERYQAYHEEKAKGGIALTMFGGSSIVSAEVSPIYNQIDVSTDAVIPHFRRFARRIHRHGAKLMCQISHMGRRTAWDDGDWIVPISPSAVRDPAHHAVPRAMEIEDIDRIVAAYGEAARRCAEGGLDGAEVLISSHLPGQFLSPAANRRQDEYGGSIENRMRFLKRILETVRAQTSAGFLVSLRMAVDEAGEGGPDGDDCLEVARRLHGAGLLDLLNLNGIGASTTRGLSELIGGMSRPLAPFLEPVARFRAAIGAPVIHASRIADLATAAHAIRSGATDLVGMTRAHFADPHIVSKLQQASPERIRPCVGAAYCIDRIYAGRAAFCLHNVATGRETWLPQTVTPGKGPRRKVVVVGGGPAGMEAARVAALRGHGVILLEAAPRLGGQVLLAARASPRRDMIGIADWLAAEIAALGVEVRTGRLAEAADVIAETPDVVIVATGGVPRELEIPGGELAAASWDVLSDQVRPDGSVLIYDEDGGHSAVSLGEHLARQGKPVTLVSRDRVIGRSLGGSSYPAYLGALAKARAALLPDRRLARIEKHGNRLRATLVHEYGDVEETVDADCVIAELGTEPSDALFHELKAGSLNRGVTDTEALKAGTPQPWLAEQRDAAGGYLLFRVGDAVASRNVHAAILDSLRLMKDV